MKDKNKLPIIISFRLSEELDKELAQVSDRLEFSKQDLMRLTMRIGLAHLESVKYDLAKCVMEKALKK